MWLLSALTSPMTCSSTVSFQSRKSCKSVVSLLQQGTQFTNRECSHLIGYYNHMITLILIYLIQVCIL